MSCLKAPTRVSWGAGSLEQTVQPSLFKGIPGGSDHLGELPHPSGGGNTLGSSGPGWETELGREIRPLGR